MSLLLRNINALMLDQNAFLKRKKITKFLIECFRIIQKVLNVKSVHPWSLGLVPVGACHCMVMVHIFHPQGKCREEEHGDKEEGHRDEGKGNCDIEEGQGDMEEGRGGGRGGFQALQVQNGPNGPSADSLRHRLPRHLVHGLPGRWKPKEPSMGDQSLAF